MLSKHSKTQKRNSIFNTQKKEKKETAFLLLNNKFYFI